jgi:hypothetical protein
MNETSGVPDEPKKFWHKEYEDPHYHDDDEVAQVPDESRSGRKPPARDPKSVLRRPTMRRRFEE